MTVLLSHVLSLARIETSAFPSLVLRTAQRALMCAFGFSWSVHPSTRTAFLSNSPMCAFARRLSRCLSSFPLRPCLRPCFPTCTSRPSAGVSTATMPLTTSRPPTSLAFWRPAATASSLVAGIIPFAFTPAMLARSWPMPRPVASSCISMAARVCSWRSLPHASAAADPG